MSLLSVWSVPTSAETIRLSLPIDCEIGPECFVQQYVDQQIGKGYRDYHCGALSYDGHRGTDFRLLNPAMLADGVSVIAAAPGTVLYTRDGMPDIDVRLVGHDAVTERSNGNFVVIDHGGGWRTIYAHLKRGSLLVKAQQVVKAGQRLGLVGMSGLTEFPHVHFQVQFGKRIIDPFVGLATHTNCGVGKKMIWHPDALAKLDYRPTMLLRTGFSTRPMKRAALQYGLYAQKALSRTRGSLYFGAFVAGIYSGDKINMKIFDSNGKRIRNGSSTIKNSAAVLFHSIAHEQATPLPAGQYRASFTLYRTKAKETKRIIAIERRLTLR